MTTNTCEHRSLNIESQSDPDTCSERGDSDIWFTWTILTDISYAYEYIDKCEEIKSKYL